MKSQLESQLNGPHRGSPAGDAEPIDIAVGVVRDSAGRILIACRPAGTASAGRWEFPGGKIESGESSRQALARELDEEVGIAIGRSRELIRFSHALGSAPVRLHIFMVDEWTGPARSRENQIIRFVEPSAMRDPAALPGTGVILNALALPSRYLITPVLGDTPVKDWFVRFENALAAGVKLVRFRQPELPDIEYEVLAERVVTVAGRVGVQVLLDRDAVMAERVGAAGLHWPAGRADRHESRPVTDALWFAISAHDRDELARAAAIGADFATLSPVFATPSHPRAAGLGWADWTRIRGDHAIPVYALGGVGEADLAAALAHNAQGIAAIGGLWP